MRKGSTMVILAAVMAISIASVSPVMTSKSTSPCAQCHGAMFYQFLDILEGNQSEAIPSAIDGPGTLNVTVVLSNSCNAGAEGDEHMLHEVSAVLSSQNRCFRVVDPTCWIGDMEPGRVNATWQIYAARSGQDRLIINTQAFNKHSGTQYTDEYSPSPSISVTYTPPNRAPAITLGTPAAGKLGGGSDYRMCWTSEDEDKDLCQVSLFYSVDDFASSNITIAKHLPNTGTHDWVIPAIDAAAVRLKAYINDSFGAVNSSLSGIFTIDSSPPGVAAVTPADGAANASESAPISIEFSEAVDRGTAERAFSILPPVFDIEWSWSQDGKTMTALHEPLEPGTAYLCIIGQGMMDTAVPANMNRTSFSWRFSVPAVNYPEPSIALSSPAGGERYYQDDSISVKWRAAGGTGTLRVNVSFTGNATSVPFGPVAAGLPDNGNFTFPAPTVISDACSVKVTAYDARGKEASFSSPATFSISRALVLDATFGSAEVQHENDTIDVSWSGTGGRGKLAVSVRFQGENGPIGIASGQPASGSLGWTVPAMNTTRGFLAVNAIDEWGTVVENASLNLTIARRGAEPPSPSKPNQPPVAVFDVGAEPVMARRGVFFNATGSRDPEMKPISYMWDFGDGTDQVSAGNGTAMHVYLNPGSYLVVLTVSDGESNATASMQVHVWNAPGQPSGGQGFWPAVALGTAILAVAIVALYAVAVRKRPLRPNEPAGPSKRPASRPRRTKSRGR